MNTFQKNIEALQSSFREEVISNWDYEDLLMQLDASNDPLFKRAMEHAKHFKLLYERAIQNVELYRSKACCCCERGKFG